MTNSLDNLIRMANRIGDFFASQPGRDEALTGIATHIRNFWEPRMRAALLDFLEQHPDGATAATALTPIVLQAITQHRASLRPHT